MAWFDQLAWFNQLVWFKQLAWIDQLAHFDPLAWFDHQAWFARFGREDQQGHAGLDLAPPAMVCGTAEGLHPHPWGLVERFFPGIAEGMVHHVGQPAAKGGNRSEGMGHGERRQGKPPA